WPTFDETLLLHHQLQILLQLNAKLTPKINIPKHLSKQQIQHLPFSNDNLKITIQPKQLKKLIPLPQNLLNILPE
ncbi:hypothetical protein, partial [Staphylococcus epidermidis]|uniref:hypothetical protein n=1 Tax=Staphylococcus epidermidis TaxID=1282 RepID=UPI0016428EBC